MLNHKIVAVLALSLLSMTDWAQAAEPEDTGIYEMRTYTTNEGKMDALHARFSQHTMALFERHGMQNVAYWSPAGAPDQLIYIVKHASTEAAKASWQAFVNDPEWQQVYAASIADGRLVKDIQSVFMSKTPYSP